MIRGGLLALGAVLIFPSALRAQSSLQTLEDELKQAKQLHQDTSAQLMSNFFTQVDAAMGSPDAAIQLYTQAGGILPDPSPVVKEHEDETATERDARLAQDRANQLSLGTVLQLHCGIMHFAALFVVDPDQKGLHDQWAGWIQKAAQAYPQLNPPLPDIPTPKPDPDPHKKKHEHEEVKSHPFSPSDIMGKSMKDSVISKFLGFNMWGDKEQGGWSVKSLPKLYRSAVLDPSRAKPTAATLASWDVYIAMANADEKDQDHWQQVVYPPLQFDRACDDYAVTPSTEKLEALVNLIKANPTFPQVDDWITRTHDLMDDYRSGHGGKPAVAQNPGAPGPFTPPPNPNVSVTTQQQGDAVIITTRTNSPPGNPAPPPQ
jgi:hypothetical protein